MVEPVLWGDTGWFGQAEVLHFPLWRRRAGREEGSRAGGLDPTQVGMAGPPPAWPCSSSTSQGQPPAKDSQQPRTAQPVPHVAGFPSCCGIITDIISKEKIILKTAIN